MRGFSLPKLQCLFLCSVARTKTPRDRKRGKKNQNAESQMDCKIKQNQALFVCLPLTLMNQVTA